MSGVRVTSLRPENPAVEIHGGIFLWNPVRAAKRSIRPLLGKAARILLILPPKLLSGLCDWSGLCYSRKYQNFTKSAVPAAVSGTAGLSKGVSAHETKDNCPVYILYAGVYPGGVQRRERAALSLRLGGKLGLSGSG